MKLSEHVDKIRQLIDISFRNRMGRMGITAGQLLPIESVPSEYWEERERIETILEVLLAETGSQKDAYEKLVEELTFTLFNRIAALKVMEAHVLHPEIITRRTQHGDRSFAHFAWLEQYPEARNDEAEGLVSFLNDQLKNLSGDIPLFSILHPYHLLPTAIELNNIISSFNEVEIDTQVEADIWKSDDVLGWLYESYNNYKKAIHKESKAKTEYNKVSIQSQVYTPRWVVKFLVDNSLGKLYLEMYPDSEIKNKYKIANAPQKQIRDRKLLTELRLIDPATGSGNYVLYGFDLFYDLYLDQIENYGADYNEKNIAKLIIEHNLYGIDLDDRAIQLAQLGLYIKAKRKKRSVKIDHFNIVSSDFFLPEYKIVKPIFEENANLNANEKLIIEDIWTDLQNAYKFGSLIRLEEKLSLRWFGTKEKTIENQISIFEQQNIDSFDDFKSHFFINLQKAIALNTAKQGMTFLNTKTQDAITFLQLLTQKYDIAVANPPYTDSADFGEELRTFINANYSKPYKFNTNLYATFIKRCCELTNDIGFVGIIHPHTFMFIKTFEDVRKYLIENTHIDLLVDYGLDRVNLFGTNILLDASWYVLSKKKNDEVGIFINIKANQQEKYKQNSLEKAFDDLLVQKNNERIYFISQSKLKIIDGWPFIYWISDGFREKFKEETIVDLFNPTQGVATTNNFRFLRFWWEVKINKLEYNLNETPKRWILYSKGGPFNKWYGNLWVVLDWNNDGEDLIKAGAVLRNRKFYFKQGITYSALGGTKISFRELPIGCIFDVGGSCIFPSKKYSNINYTIAFFNSSLTRYLVECLNPTVNVQVGDIQRIPFVIPSLYLEDIISNLTSININIKKNIYSYRLVETNFENNPLSSFPEITLNNRVLSFMNFENEKLALVLLNESIINQLIYKVYELSDEDRLQVETKMGTPVGELPVLFNAKEKFLNDIILESETLKIHIDNLQELEFEDTKIQEIKSELILLYQTNNDLEEFCIRHQLNPINVWYWFKEANILPQARAAEITLEFLADAIRTVLMEDEDGIIPLVGLPGEPRLSDRLEQHCLNNGFTSAQYMQLDSLLGRPVNEYIEHHFFKQLSDHLNLFMFLPKTPFIWHLSSGVHQGFEVYIIIYKWNRDNLYNLKTNYIAKRIENLEYRQIQIANSDTAQSQNEKEKIRLQLQEISDFTVKVDELIAEGYNPILDDGVGKNIAPLQKKGMLRHPVLKDTQLEKYLNADW